METKRVRLVFKNDEILSDTQKSDGLNRCWVLLKPDQHRTIADIASHLLQAFQLHNSCPHGLLLSMDGFVLPPYESTTILKDKDMIRVRKREDALFIGHNAAHSVKKLKALEKQPVNSSFLLLSNVELEKGKEVYESDDSEEEDDPLENMENPPTVNADSKKRKRKASEKLQCSMKKKHHSEAPKTVASDDHFEKIENTQQDGVPIKRKSLSQVEKKSDSKDKENEENNQKNAKLIDDDDDSTSSTKRSLELQENVKEIKDASHSPKETKKVPSRSARRKRAKRQWLSEMAKIQKKNATSESESFRNWKEDQAKAERNKADGQPRVVNWKKDPAKAEREVDGQRKGLLNWKQYPESKTSNNMEKHQQQNQNINAHEHSNRNGTTSWHSNQYNREEAEAVPVVVRPGHIRFRNVGEEPAVPKSQLPVEKAQWSRITSQKGQKWGTTKCSFTQRNDREDSNKVCCETPNNEKETVSYTGIDFDNLQPLCSMPKAGDVIAYRTLELSSSWIPELSPYRVRKVSWYDAGSGQIMLIPVSEYPVVSKKLNDDESAQPDNSISKEDEALEIDFYSLVDVRIVKGDSSGPINVGPSRVNGSPMGNESAAVTVSSSSNNKQTVVPSQENTGANNGNLTQAPEAECGGVSAWDSFLTETLPAGEEQPSEKNSWSKSAKVQLSQFSKNVNTVQPQHEDRWGKNAKRVQPPGENNWGRKNAGRKPSSFRNSTMSRWKNGN